MKVQTERMARRSPEGEVFVRGGPELELLLSRFASASCPILITGETGAGKSCVARQIHDASDRAREPFVHVDCSSLPELLIETELFGHERGAFTGADLRRLGRFELAGSGSIFLDEIGDMNLPCQRRLLHVLEEREFFRVGGSRTVPMNARVLAATNQDLPRLVARGEFRADLYHRLAVARLVIPSLRERVGDLPAFIGHALNQVSMRVSWSVGDPGEDFVERLAAYHWPGNVRELFNVIEHVVVRLGPDRLRLRASDLDGILPDAEVGAREAGVARCSHCGATQLRGGSSGGPRDGATAAARDPEAARIDAVLRATGGNVSRASRRLGIARSTLRYRIERLRLGHLVPRD